MYYKTEGIILSQKNFGEADKLLTIFTRDNGKISCIAKGARRPLSKKSGHIELGNWCKVFLARGKNIDLLTEVELKKAYGIDNLSIEKSNKIYHFLEIVNSLTEQDQKNITVFYFLKSYLNKLQDEDNFNLLSTVYKVKLLSWLGFFSAENLQNQKSKVFFLKIEKENFDMLKKSINLDDKSYLKLLSFLDSIVENLIERQLKTSKFI